jgi:hypothetical protein
MLITRIQRNAYYEDSDEDDSEFIEEPDHKVNLSTVVTARKLYLAMVTA